MVNMCGWVRNDPDISCLDLPGCASLSLPGVLRIAYPQFIHYEFYVPIDSGHTKYVGVMVQFKSGLAKAKFYLKYLLGIRWLFHGQFSGQDHWVVEQTDAPPERLYRPDRSEEHTSELQSLMRISYAVFCLKTKKQHKTHTIHRRL